MSRLRNIALAAAALTLSGCKAVVLHPSGDVAAQQRDLLIISTWLMLVIIVPVIALTIWFAWKYRTSNKKADYEPEWDHSLLLELIIWAAPLLIIISLGAITWTSTHLLDPFRPLDRIAEGHKIERTTKPLEIEAVALDWKWLFIYPEYGIATVNEFAAPIDRPIEFRITASSVMNDFYIPALAGQIYAMPGMETKLNAVINEPGKYKGFSANYSGAGFSGMHFTFVGLNDADFSTWTQNVKSDGVALSQNNYLALEKPSENEPVRHYASVASGLYDGILGLCIGQGRMCMNNASGGNQPRQTVTAP